MVTVYSKPACVQCNATTTTLDRLGIDYNKVDISQDNEALELVLGLGYQQVPVVMTSTGEHWGGFNMSKIRSLV